MRRGSQFGDSGECCAPAPPRTKHTHTSQTMEINLGGTFNVLRLSAEQMAAGGADEGGERGCIINTARWGLP